MKANKLLNLTFFNENLLFMHFFSHSFLTTMTWELLKHLNEHLGVFLNVKQQKWSQLKYTKIGFFNILSNTYVV